jgi:hypothetical protein
MPFHSDDRGVVGPDIKSFLLRDVHRSLEHRTGLLVYLFVEIEVQPFIDLTNGNIVFQIGGILQFHKGVEAVVDESNLPTIIDMKHREVVIFIYGLLHEGHVGFLLAGSGETQGHAEE